MRRLTQEGPDPQTAASSFVRGFAQKYGDRRPRWLECGWAEGCRTAHGQFKFLFVYLHSPSHQVGLHAGQIVPTFDVFST